MSRASKLTQKASTPEKSVYGSACGSGHILVYAFGLLYVYLEAGYPAGNIPTMILEKTAWARHRWNAAMSSLHFDD